MTFVKRRPDLIEILEILLFTLLFLLLMVSSVHG